MCCRTRCWKKSDVRICVGTQCSKANTFFSLASEYRILRTRSTARWKGSYNYWDGFGQTGVLMNISQNWWHSMCRYRWISNQQVNARQNMLGGFDLPVTVVVGNQESTAENLFKLRISPMTHQKFMIQLNEVL